VEFGKLFRKRKEVVEKKENPEDLKTFCGEDTELFAILEDKILIDPERMTMEEAENKAKEFESLKPPNLRYAGIYYKHAGCIALFHDDVEKVKKYFSKYHKLFPDKPIPILNNPEKAVVKAQEYYQKRGQKEKKT